MNANPKLINAIAHCPGPKEITLLRHPIVEHLSRTHTEEAAVAITWYVYYATRKQTDWIDKFMETAE